MTRVHYELRDYPDDLPIICTTLAEAERKARHRVEHVGGPVLIYEMRTDCERFIGAIG